MPLSCLPKVKQMLGWTKAGLRLPGLGKPLRAPLPAKGTGTLTGAGRGGGSTAELGSVEEAMLKPSSSEKPRQCLGTVTKEPSWHGREQECDEQLFADLGG